MSYDEAVKRIERAYAEKATSLDLSHLELEAVPERLCELTSLQLLRLDSNHLTSLPEWLGDLKSLQRLDLDNNHLTSLPERLGELKSLQMLYLHYNRLTSVPEQLGELKSLQLLYLHYNRLASVPERLGELAALRELRLDSNQLTSVPERLGELAALRGLRLDGNQLTSVPEQFGDLAALRELRLDGNQLTSVPEQLGELTSLQRLDLDDNQLTSVPERLGELAALEKLYLHNNRLTTLPERLGELAALEKLYLHNNRLTTLPERLGELAALRELRLDGNQLTSVPERFGELAALQVLWLNENQLTSVPERFGELTALRTLRLDNNKLTSVPERLGELTAFRELYLHGNDQLGISPEILGLTWSEVIGDVSPAKPGEILDYYFRTRAGARPLNEAKLILVGNGRVGKTSLVKKMKTGEFNPNEPETEGIEIEKWGIPVCFDELGNKQEEIHLHIWDFGGQEFLHATHRFFLTGRSLYLLVLDRREGGAEAEAEYWLELIQGAGEHSRVLVVLNKNAGYPFDVNRRLLQEKFPIILDFIKTDCETGLGIEDLKQAVARETARLEGVHSAFPGNWFRIKNRLSGMTEPFLTFDRYRDLCEEFDVPDGTDQERLADVLNALGIALNFRKNEFLGDTHVLNPRWVTGGVYAILYSKQVREAKGELKLADLGGILDRGEYPRGMHEFLMRLMRQFELCFAFANSPERFLIPELLEENEPDAVTEFKPEDCLNFEYHYSVLPEGLLPRFIVRTHEMSEGEPRWRTGAILNNDGCRALVKADVQGKKVFIRVSGEKSERRRMLYLIRSQFNMIHKAVNLNAEEMVPLPAYPKEVISYQELLTFEAEGVAEYPKVIDKKIVRLPVKALVDGVGRPQTSRRVVVDTLARLMESQLGLLKAQLPPQAGKFLAGKDSSPAEKAASVIEWAETPGGCGLEGVVECIDAVIGDSSWRESPHRAF